jgi:hypothetical protein
VCVCFKCCNGGRDWEKEVIGGGGEGGEREGGQVKGDGREERGGGWGGERCERCECGSAQIMHLGTHTGLNCGKH